MSPRRPDSWPPIPVPAAHHAGHHPPARGRTAPASRRPGTVRAAAALALAAGLTACGGERADAPPSARPERIVLLVVDTLRRDHVGAYGGRVATPNMDRLAERGQRFPDAWSSFHQTTMSMASLFTGRTPSLEQSGQRERVAWTGRTWCGLLRAAEGRVIEVNPGAG